MSIALEEWGSYLPSSVWAQFRMATEVAFSNVPAFALLAFLEEDELRAYGASPQGLLLL